MPHRDIYRKAAKVVVMGALVGGALTAVSVLSRARAADANQPVQIAYAVPGPANTAAVLPHRTPPMRATFRPVETSLFPKWHDALQRTAQQLGARSSAVIAAPQVARGLAQFQRIVQEVASKSGLGMLTAVNDLVSQVPYRSDREVYGVSDYWATPVEMFANQGGDCEDHAIAKLMVLKAAGVAEENLHLIVGIDTASGKPHAIAVVDIEGVSYALDSRTNRVTAWSEAGLRFRPLYAAGFHDVRIYRS
jgi:predicted transglutaminase-like cysteine proteinase